MRADGKVLIVDDLTGQSWFVKEGPDPSVGFRIYAGSEIKYVVQDDPRKMNPVDFWDVVDPGEPRTKLENLVDREDATAIEKIFSSAAYEAPQQYRDALDSPGTNDWRPLYRATLLSRNSVTIRALVRAGADPAGTQGPKAWPFHRWTPVALAFTVGNAQLLGDLFSRPKMDDDLVAGALEAARIVDLHRESNPPDLLQQAVLQSRAASKQLKADPLSPPSERALDYVAKFLRVPKEDAVELSNAARRGALTKALFSLETPLTLALIQRDLDAFERTLDVETSAEELEKCEVFLSAVTKVQIGADRWAGFAEHLRKRQISSRLKEEGPSSGLKWP